MKKLRFVQNGHDGIIGLLNLLPHLFAADVVVKPCLCSAERASAAIYSHNLPTQNSKEPLFNIQGAFKATRLARCCHIRSQPDQSFHFAPQALANPEIHA